MDTPERRRRRDDHWLCWVALRAGQFWEFVDRRDLDKHALSIAIFYGTIVMTKWAFAFAELARASGATSTDTAAVILAVTGPYMAMQAAALKYYFETRE